MKSKLKLLSQWLKEASINNSVYKDTERDGALENAIKTAQEETCSRIGDYLEEIINMNDDEINSDLYENKIK